MTKKTKHNHKLQIYVGAYANYLQQQLSITVTPAVFFNSGYHGPVSDTPCSLITVEPFCPGGKRRLVLNAHHPLILAIAEKFAKANHTTAAAAAAAAGNTTADTTATATATTTTTDDDTLLLLLLQLGQAMILTASMPLTGLDVYLPMEPLQWKMARGLSCGPHTNWITPVPHETLNDAAAAAAGGATAITDREWGWPALAIWPKKQIGIIVVAKDKSDPSSKIKEKVVVTHGDKWKKRDEILWQEWKQLLWQRGEKGMGGGGGGGWKCMFQSGQGEQQQQQQQVVVPVALSCGMATFSPFLPVLALAQFLQSSSLPLPSSSSSSSSSIYQSLHANNQSSAITVKYLKVGKMDALRTAASILLSCDRLFCLSLFFGMPLLDRTRTLHGAIQVDVVVRNTPTREEVEEYMVSCGCFKNGDHSDGDNDGDGGDGGVFRGVHNVLEKAMLKRASDIWQMARSKHVDIVVCWSGGIDSTALLVALLRTASSEEEEQQQEQQEQREGGKSKQKRSRLVVTCDDESIAENSSFFSMHIQHKLKIIERKEQTISDLARENPDSLIVTGELGDQLFGSDRCRMYFPLPKLTGLTPEEEELMKDIGGEMDDGSSAMSLDDPWEESLLIVLQNRGLLAGTMSQWKSWISPQLDKAPFKIKTLFDMLWWLNFSCKWQNVALRHMHDGGGLFEADGSMVKSCGSVIHFYDDRQLECWACVEEFHKKKFGDWKEWKTYKEPLKFFIHSFHQDPNYYHEKEKVVSLALSLTDSQNDHSDRCIGIYKDAQGVLKQFQWSLSCAGNYLEQLLDPWIWEQRDTVPPFAETVISIDPWTDSAESERPFILAPYFAHEDERRYRPNFPVTVHTLTAKCAALLPPDTVKGKTVLDLGACLGAMCHWSLFHGAKSVLGVEPQMQFCKRMIDYLKRAENTWNDSNSDAEDDTPSVSLKSDDRYKIICIDARSFLSQCKDHSFDIVVIAGVLHCFQDPVTIISEVARVSKEIVTIESMHPRFQRKGFYDPVHAVNFLELSPSAKVNKAGEEVSFTGLACVPSKQLIQNTMCALGFSVSTVNVAHHPTRNEDILTYNGMRRFDATPCHFFLHCTRTKALPLSMKTLEDVVLSGKGVEHTWINVTSNSWTSFSDCVDRLDLQDGSDNHHYPSYENFISWEGIEKNAHDVLFDASKDEHPYKVQAWGEQSKTKNTVFDEGIVTVFGYVYKGETTVVRKSSTSLPIVLSSGMCFCCPDRCEIKGGSGLLIIVPRSCTKSHCLFTFSGPLQEDSKGELVGSLPYIDGCTDTILIHPQIMGDPCFNHLHFPSNVKQTQHTHPSGRAGLVIKGEGTCAVIDPLTKQVTKATLRPGMAFVIPKNAPHTFETEGTTLDMIAFHPDSDYGPTNTNHPMVNRTIVDGISASLIPSIQTQME